MTRIVADRGASPPAFGLADHSASSLSALREEAMDCRRCDLYKNATQVVFGQGLPNARIALVGEQPGDHEDLEGQPFVGPAGRVLDECLALAGIARKECYVTNSVKHFKFELRGKKRLHSKPNAGEIKRCAWWLGAEIKLLRPDIIVALGATALYALAGRSATLGKVRGKILQIEGFEILPTIHPSYLLRLRGHGDIERERKRFIDDLKLVAEAHQVSH